MKRTRLYLLLPTLAAGLVAATTASGTRATEVGDTATPIKHLVVIFQENVSFDHYFGTYPVAANSDGQKFAAAPGTPSVNGLSSNLLTSNPNASNPVRLDSSANGPGGNGNGVLTCDQGHNYGPEQMAFDGGAMDKFVQTVGRGTGSTPAGTATCNANTVMDYYDGNVVTGFWNYAQHYAMSDNSFGTTYGPSAPGAINLVSGDTGNVDLTHVLSTPLASNSNVVSDGLGGYSLIGDAQPYWDDCSTNTTAVAFTGANIGDELNAAGLSWGWFQGGFRPTTDFATAAAAAGHTGQSTATFIPDEFKVKFFVSPATDQGICNAVTPVGSTAAFWTGTASWGYKDDYIPHHEPFQYYASTANPHHLPPASLSAIGTDTQSYIGTTPQFDTANHNYDSRDFDELVSGVNAGTLPASALPAVTFLKAPGFQDGHPAYSDPLDEQTFVTKEINALERSPDWSSTAVIISYDDSDGWYDHAYPGVQNPSASSADSLSSTGHCGTEPPAPLANQQGRCGFGPRMPLIVISPWARTNYVDHNLSDQSSIVNFIEYNWHLPAIPGSFDSSLAGADAAEGIPFDLAGLFDFSHQSTEPQWQLDPATGQIDLRNSSISGRNLKGENISGAEAAGAAVTGSNLQGAFLANIDLHGASLQGTNLQQADLTGANLTGAKLQGANLKGANLTGANLTGATLAGSNTNKVTWSNTTCVDGTNSNTDGGSCTNHL